MPPTQDPDLRPTPGKPAARSYLPSVLYRLPNVTAAVALVLGLTVTFTMVRAESKNLERVDRQRFARQIDRMSAEVTRRVIVYRYGLMGTRSVFAASESVERHEFIDLVAARELESEFPGALGIGYIHRVPSAPQAFEAYVRSVRDDGAPWFDITVPPGAEPLPGALTDDRYIIQYIEPLARNRSAHGLDIGAHPVRREAAERCLRVNDACLTGTIQLVQEDQKVAGFLYMLPLFTPGMPVETLEQRVEALEGWAYMPMLGPKVFEDITAVADQELDIEVFDGESLRKDALIYDADEHLRDIDASLYTREHFEDRAFHTLRPIEIGGRTWTLSMSATPQFEHASRASVWQIGVAGGALSLLVSAFIFIQGSSTRKAWALAEGMTADLRSYAEQAGQATQAKSAFLANMSHEIRTPMTAILGFTDLLRTQIDDDNRELLEHTQTIKRNGEHLLTVINDILDLSKIEAGKLSTERIEVRPDTLVGEVLSLMRVKASQKQLSLDAKLTTPIPAVVHSDPVRIRQVLVNLVGNAIKFTQSGGVEINVRYDGARQTLEFAVVDTGVGMSEAQTAQLFGAFEQADASTTREFGGTGLGLHISQRLAQMLGGQITCSTRLGLGSTFTLAVDAGNASRDDMIPAGPLLAAEPRDARVPDRHGPVVPSNPPGELDKPLLGMTILLAEDGKDNQRLINHHLTRAGARVKIVENGRLAVAALCVNDDITRPLHKHPPYDLLLTDMQMPEMDGYTAVRLLRDKGSTLPIVALTAHAMKEDFAKCLAAGCDDYASKPIDKQKLIEVCQRAVAKKVTA
jgi:signal transduction histidine kinase/ActR/RegA family two-component response regulator